MHALLAPSLLFTLSAAPALAQGTVHVVDSLGGPGAMYADIQPAVDAAVDGDTVLIRPGIYTGFTVDGKDLDLFGDVDASTSAKVLTGRTVIRNVPAGELVTLSDLRLTAGLEVTDADGPVVLQGLVFGDTFVGDAEPTTQVGLDIRRSKDVTLGRSWVGGYVATGGLQALMDGPTAMRIEESSVYAWDTTVTGGRGASGVASAFLFPGLGGAAVDVIGASLRGDDVTLVGGRGGHGIPGGFCTDGAAGGTGLVQSGASSAVELFASSIQPGAGGQPGAATCSSGPAGATTDLTGGLLSQLAGQPAGYTAGFVVREGASLPLVVEGGPTAAGAAVLWLVADTPSSLPMDLGTGVLASTAPSILTVLGVAGPTGGLASWVTVPDLGSGIQALTLISQAALLTTSGELRLTEPEATLLLDASF